MPVVCHRGFVDIINVVAHTIYKNVSLGWRNFLEASSSLVCSGGTLFAGVIKLTEASPFHSWTEQHCLCLWSHHLCRMFSNVIHSAFYLWTDQWRHILDQGWYKLQAQKLFCLFVYSDQKKVFSAQRSTRHLFQINAGSWILYQVDTLVHRTHSYRRLN